MTIKLTDRAWAAGFFDGEGHVRAQVGRRYKRPYPTIIIGQVDRRPLDRLRRILRLGNVTGPHRTNHPRWQPYYQFYVSGYRDCGTVARLLWPYLSPAKQAQFWGAGFDAGGTRLRDSDKSEAIEWPA